MYILLIFSILTFGHCADLDWWENAAFYQIYPRSFADSDGNGIGDLKGITDKLDYLKDIGIDAFWLSPIFKSPMYDFGYDISDFRDIDPTFGTLDDFKNLVKKAKSLGLKVILDYVPNHTSHEHEWFLKSVAREPGYEDYYMWHDGFPNATGGDRIPPNNWISIFHGSAWTWHETREQFYFHVFLKEQPELHYRSENMRNEMPSIMKFWLDLGVDGFRIDATPHLMEVGVDAEGNYPNEPENGTCTNPNDHCFLDHIYTVNQDDSFKLLYEWRDFLAKYKTDNGGDTRIAMCEHYADVDIVMRVYGEKGDTNKGPMMPFNFLILQEFNNQSTASDLKATIDKWMSHKPAQFLPNWVMGNHDGSRVGSRLGADMIDWMNVLMLSLPGASVNYYGEEIGMVDGIIPAEIQKDERDICRTPMQWNTDKNAGFSTGASTWLPVNQNYLSGTNVQSELSTVGSHLYYYKQMMAIKKSNAVKTGAFETKVVDNVLLILRGTEQERYVILLNLNNRESKVNPFTAFNLNMKWTYAFTHKAGRTPGAGMEMAELTLAAKEAVVIKSNATAIKIQLVLLSVLAFIVKYSSLRFM